MEQSSSGHGEADLDVVVQGYIAQHELSVVQYDQILQEVINTIAHEFTEADPAFVAGLHFDEHGNADRRDVLALLDGHQGRPPQRPRQAAGRRRPVSEDPLQSQAA